MATALSSFGAIISEIRGKLIPLADEAWRVRVFVNDAPDWSTADFDLDGAIKETLGLLSDLEKIRERKDQYRADLQSEAFRQAGADGYIAEIERLRRIA